MGTPTDVLNSNLISVVDADKKPLSLGGRMSLIGQGNLNIVNVTSDSDSGHYACSVSSSAAAFQHVNLTSKPAHLTVISKYSGTPDEQPPSSAITPRLNPQSGPPEDPCCYIGSLIDVLVCSEESGWGFKT